MILALLCALGDLSAQLFGTGAALLTIVPLAIGDGAVGEFVARLE